MRFSRPIQSVISIVLTVCLCAGLIPPGVTLPVFTRSGALAESAGEWLYRIGEDGYAEVLGYRDASVSALSIPSSLGGAWVTGIADDAFADNTALETISVPAAVSQISPTAFPNHTELTLQAKKRNCCTRVCCFSRFYGDQYV